MHEHDLITLTQSKGSPLECCIFPSNGMVFITSVLPTHIIICMIQIDMDSGLMVT